MNKLTKVLSVFLLAGAIGTGVAGAAGCVHNHTFGNDLEAKDANQHGYHATCGHDVWKDLEDHKDTTGDNKCDDCGYELTETPDVGSQLIIAKEVEGLIVEGVTGGDVQLSKDKTSHSIDKAEIHVYGETAEGKGSEIPSAYLDIKLTNPAGTAITEWSGLKENGTYNITVKVINAKMEEGAEATIEDLVANVSINVKNAVVDGSLKAKEGGTFTQVQGADTISSTWEFEVERENGDKQDVPAANVTISGLNTNTVGEDKEATLSYTIEGKTVTGTVKYTITKDESKVSQSFALNPAELTAEQKDKLKTEDVSVQNGRFVIQATSGEVADHTGSAPEYEGKYLAERIKMGGKYDGDNAKRYIQIKVDGAATITVYGYANSGTAGQGAAGRYLSLYENVTFEPKASDETKKVAKGTGLVGERQDTKQKENTTHVWEVTEAGTYWLVCEEGDVCITYVQVDQLVASGEGVEEIPLGGEKKLVKLSTKTVTKDYKQTFTVNAPFTVNELEYSFEGIYYNTVTADKVEEKKVTEGLTYWLGETQLTVGETPLTALGEQTITVKVNGETAVATYKIVVESAVEGITGITASVKSSVNTQVDTADAKLTLNKSDIEIALVGTNENASVTSYTVKYKAKDAEDTTAVEITESAELGVGEYVLLVSATVTDSVASKSADFNATCELNVTKKLEDGELSAVTVTFEAESPFSPVLSLTGNTVSSVTCDTTEGQLRAQSGLGCYNTKGTSISSNKFNRRYITINLKQAGTYTITVTAKTSAAGRHVAIAENTDTMVTVSSTEVGNGSFTDTIFENVVISGTTLLIGSDANIDISQIIITPVA